MASSSQRKIRRKEARRVVRHAYRRHFDPRRERALCSGLAFIVTFAAVRGITYSILMGVGPFHNVQAGGVHIHHLVWGIVLLLIVGYLWLVHVGIGAEESRRWMSIVTAVAFGIGAALTLDEFALWLFLDADVYWGRGFRLNVDAIIVFGVLIWIAYLIGPFTLAVARELRELRDRLELG